MKKYKIDKSKLHFGTPEREEESEYSLFRRTQPCKLTNDLPTDYMSIDPIHLRKFTDGGMGKKPSDWFISSLRHDLHQLQHSLGERTFYIKAFSNELPGVPYGEQLMFEALAALFRQDYEGWKSEVGELRIDGKGAS